MRWFVFHKRGNGIPPWVMAELPDEALATDFLYTQRVVLSESEARKDPVLSAAVDTWCSGDDSAHHTYMALLLLETEELEARESSSEGQALFDRFRALARGSDLREAMCFWNSEVAPFLEAMPA